MINYVILIIGIWRGVISSILISRFFMIIHDCEIKKLILCKGDKLFMEISIVLSILSLFVTILGFILTFFQINRKYNLAIKQIKKNNQLSMLEILPEKIINFTTKMFNYKVNNEEMFENLQEIKRIIFSYGTKTEMRILSRYENTIITNSIKSNNEESIALLLLLSSQIKADVTDEYVSPLYFYKMIIMDNGEWAKKYIEINNLLINELNIDKRFMM